MAAEFDPALSVFQGFQDLQRRLDPIIQRRVSEFAPGMAWPRVLEELDRVKGRSPGIYGRTDASAQLRMLTERLGAIGFPFESMPPRYVSTLAGDLRIARNSVAHNNPIDIHDAIRMHDSATKLLAHFGDDGGAQAAAAMRAEAIVCASGVVPSSPQSAQTDEEQDVADRTHAEHSSNAEPITVLPVSEGSLTAEVLRSVAWEPWRVTIVGDKDDLENFRRVGVKEKLHAVVAEIVDFEFPLSLERLIDLVRRSYGVGRLHKPRRAAVERQVRSYDDVIVDEHGFVWPEGVDREAWRDVRPNGESVGRRITDVSPHEVANAIRSIRAEHPDFGDDELDREVVRCFGGRRLTAAFAEHLSLARSLVARER